MLHEKIEQLQSNESMQRDSVGFNAKLNYYDIRVVILNRILIKLGRWADIWFRLMKQKKFFQSNFNGF